MFACIIDKPNTVLEHFFYPSFLIFECVSYGLPVFEVCHEFLWDGFLPNPFVSQLFFQPCNLLDSFGERFGGIREKPPDGHVDAVVNLFWASCEAANGRSADKAMADFVYGDVEMAHGSAGTDCLRARR